MITLIRGDITAQPDIDAIVNAAHPSLEGGGGVDGAIHRAAGGAVYAECCEYPVIPHEFVTDLTLSVLSRDAPWRPRGVRCNVGMAHTTRAGLLPNKIVIHTVGPLYKEYDHPETMVKALNSAYTSSFEEARAHKCRTVALPAISCGVFGFPLDKAAEIALEVACRYDGCFDEIRFVLFDPAAFDAFSAAYTVSLAAGAIQLPKGTK